MGVARSTYLRWLSLSVADMVSADALIIAKSSLSVVAGYLSSGRVFTPERTRAPSVIGRLERCT